jgi:hypothetical protein
LPALSRFAEVQGGTQEADDDAGFHR